MQQDKLASNETYIYIMLSTATTRVLCAYRTAFVCTVCSLQSRCSVEPSAHVHRLFLSPHHFRLMKWQTRHAYMEILNTSYMHVSVCVINKCIYPQQTHNDRYVHVINEEHSIRPRSRVRRSSKQHLNHGIVMQTSTTQLSKVSMRTTIADKSYLITKPI